MRKVKPSRTATAAVLTLAVCSAATAPREAAAQPVPGGTLDPLTIPKYVTPLVIPPVLFDDGKRPLKVEVALREIGQQVLPPTDISGSPLPPTPLWAYGDPDRPETFNNPAFTIEVTKDKKSRVKWINQLVKDPDRCFDKKHRRGKNRKACKFLPHIIQDAEGNPVIDQTLHWAAPNQDCREGPPRPDCRGNSDEPYTGPVPMVTHLHGAHVTSESDGYPEAWWLPDASNIPSGYATTGTYYDTTVPTDPGSAVFRYRNDQPTTTLWYHDHSLGITRLNVYAAAAGFWLIRTKDDGETGLIWGKLPGPAPRLSENPNCFKDGDGDPNRVRHTVHAFLKGLGADLNIPFLRDHGKGKDGDNCVRRNVREIPIVVQPKSFNADGTQYYPADRAFFEGLGTGQFFADNTGLNIPFLPQPISDIAPVWNPEAFFNTMVVNGNTWPQLGVASERYRFRLLNAADSRFVNLSLRVVVDAGADGVMGTADDTLGEELPFYQIGAEQSLLPQVVRIETGFATPLPGDGTDVGTGVNPVPGTFAQQALLVGPAERADVIVDFSDLPDGTIVRMINTAPDAPFGGFPDVPADPGTTGQVMQFVVDTTLNNVYGDPSTPPANLVLDSNPGGDPKLGDPDAIQDLALLEEASALLCVTIDAVTGEINLVPNSTPPDCANGGEPFAPKAAVLGTNGSTGGTVQLWSDPIQQNPALDSVETWELWNWSADAHPIHLHLVKFEVVNRQVIGGAVRDPEPWEAGWKDTVIAYPGEITRVKALFDIAGLYVWHCHILSHEDNEMMVPYCVGEPGVDCPAELF